MIFADGLKHSKDHLGSALYCCGIKWINVFMR